METKNRLTTEQRSDMIKLYQSGTPIVQLSKDFKVSRPTVYNILSKAKVSQEIGPKESVDEETTSFLGVTIDPVNGPFDFKIKKALKQSASLLNIVDFLKVTKFKLNMTMFDYFWQVLVGNQRSMITTLVLEWFGYEGDFRTQRQNFKRMLKNNGIQFRELTQKDKELEQFPTAQEELQLLPHEGARACSKFLVMEPRDLKIAIMQLKTKNGDTIREYYIDLEELLKLYVEYTLYFNHRESQRKITDLEKMMVDMKLDMRRQEEYMRSLGITLEEVRDQNDTLIDKTKGLKKQNKDIQRKLGIAVEDRAPLPVSEEKQERFVLLKLNDPDYQPYYTMRAQNSYIERRLKTRRLNFPEMEVLLDLKAHPNSKTLYNRIKDELKAKGVTFDGNSIDLVGSDVTQEELVNEMKVINDQKYLV